MPAWYSGLYMSVLEQLWMCVFCLQELQGVEAVENPLGQVGDLISIQHSEKPQRRQECHTPHRCVHANPHAEARLRGYSQGVEGA